MTIDENVFFREATLRICSSLNIVEALRSCFDYVKLYIPMNRMYLHLYDADLNLTRLVASARDDMMEEPERILSFPEKGRSERATELKADLLKDEVVIRVRNQPDQEGGIPKVLERFGLKSKTSLMNMLLKLVKGNQIGSLVVFADGLNQYTDEHARLLRLLHEPFAIALSNALSHEELIRLKDIVVDDNVYLHQELRRSSGDEIIGGDFGLKRVMELVQQVAPLSSPVLLLGETGVGKELIAHAIHRLSPRGKGPFIAINCGAIPETLIDSELFGHEKGAFTGAISQKRGRFERANRGTILLDEIGELPAQAQVRMLRVLENGEIERVGGSESITVDIRIIAATHRNLEEMVKTNRFREDLWFRLNVFPIVVPPLRERKEDIPALVRHFIGRKSKELGLFKSPTLAHGAIDRLIAYRWPGNVRELENVIERAMILRKDGPLTFNDLLPVSPESRASALQARENERLKLDEVVSRHIQQVLKMTRGKVHGPGGAAELLGINPSTLRSRMNQLGISYGRRRQ